MRCESQLAHGRAEGAAFVVAVRCPQCGKGATLAACASCAQAYRGGAYCQQCHVRCGHAELPLPEEEAGW